MNSQKGAADVPPIEAVNIVVGYELSEEMEDMTMDIDWQPNYPELRRFFVCVARGVINQHEPI